MQHGGQITAATPLQVRARDDPIHRGAEQAPECLTSDSRGPNAPPGLSHHFTGSTGYNLKLHGKYLHRHKVCTPAGSFSSVTRLTVKFLCSL